MAEHAFVRHDRHGEVHVLRLANPPVNTLRHALRRELVAALDDAAAAGAKAVVLIGEGRMFSAGAEMTEFGGPRLEPTLTQVIDALDAFPGLTVAAIHGHALGGGLELALGCRARVAAPSAQVGLPEVKRGILPGAGGTQRLPRLIGAEPALALIATGDSVPAPRAKELGIIDAIIEGDLAEGAIAFARAALASGHAYARVRDRVAAGELAAFDAAAAAVAKRARGMEAPPATAEAVRAALTEPFEHGLATERRLFERLVRSEQSQALRHAFFAEREAQKVAGLAGIEPRPVARAAVVGAGTMGGGIAMSFAAAGIPITIVETTAEALARGLARVESNWRRSVKSGRLTDEDVSRLLGLIRGTTDLAEVRDADVVIEAVFEDMEVKQGVFRELDRLAKPGAVLATNTSYLDVDAIAGVTSRPGDVLGMHFFSPANVMRLLEIVRGRATTAAALATAIAVGRRIAKVPVVVGNCFGFVGNRMSFQRGRQGELMLQEGALPWEVDRVMTDFGLAMGPFAVADLAGLDIGGMVRNAFGIPFPIADAMVAAGRLGQKTGRGWYRYAGGSRTPEPDPETERMILEISASLGRTRRAIPPAEIVDRMTLSLVNEGARILEEGIAARASDIDVIFVNGYGWPAWRGGPMWHADRMGLPAVRDRLAELAALTGDDGLKPAPLIERLAASGGSFAKPA
ncbi:3-hydroxyacyl-CoA dehydrogenase NAD-binding domain-containing protein [Elioraea sp.]|uniref:3-hydroxyacyl-CoA dehydrogenase NAD-binding domain-containing protein n=1 Tax=Elioraea sp. TaxID=2185103 RepID=UPI0021DCEFDE|nr:3-hydroxyacyl-CoA dehydrogenase NAD-binding domain-containing protein [Elioraea sp.]GIX11965.1 MAG: 3-hydroxyacyl-CoA dehydrogenase [Elioraea sp.]